MSNNEKISYRFSGYRPPLVQLDSTGPSYWIRIEPHPYYKRQPPYWKRPAYQNKINSKKMYNFL